MSFQPAAGIRTPFSADTPVPDLVPARYQTANATFSLVGSHRIECSSNQALLPQSVRQSVVENTSAVAGTV